MDGNRLEFLFKMPLDIDLKRLLCHTPGSVSSYTDRETLNANYEALKILAKDIDSKYIQQNRTHFSAWFKFG